MSTLEAIDWDAWRNAYPTLSYEDQQAFHEGIYRQHPTQRAHDRGAVMKALACVDALTVVELGGWDGSLAHAMLARYDGIRRWTNVEICLSAADAGVGRHPRYEVESLDGFYWNKGPWHCDLFVASHVIEHLSAYHLDQTIAATKAKAIYLDAPLEHEPTDWTGYEGSHVLEIGWFGVDDILNTHGYKLQWIQPSEHGKACLYTTEER